ncbi:Hsp20/alpha crystallin family protein [Agromyces bauzanensis]|uniref:Heat-shock protein Hsp20 n=1 Tax=Agromyces bauzanensis TaxID=1308924 RepID=A0A917URW9_9MICO|nr:Hsp20/alpha crystallin family protein [Agromyces bauzanensis]GGJ80360.1 heat-shock protein Hsp20 [Agromyces bauzanensis]
MAGSLSRFDPFAELSALQKQLFSEGLFGLGRRPLPTTDIFTEDDSKLTVEAHLPGFAEGDIEIDVDQGALVIRAEKHEKEEDKGKKYVVRESSSSYYRRIQLPEQADEDAVTALFETGVLRVTVPFKELPSPRKISINRGGPSDAGGGAAS